MKLLMDFVNIKKWNTDTLFEMFKTHGIFFTIDGRETGVEYAFASSEFSNKIFFRKLDKTRDDLRGNALSDIIVLPGEPLFNDVFKWLSELQKKWAATLACTIESGPKIDRLNRIAASTRMTYQRGKDLFDIETLAVIPDDVTIEKFLEFEYLKIFLNGRGNEFKKLRQCRKDDCGAWFIYNRPKQNFCCDKCRLAFHYDIKKEAGMAEDAYTNEERAEYMRKARAEGRYQ